MAFLVTSSNSSLLHISIALHLSGLRLSQPELIQVPISEEQDDSNDAAISQLVTWGAGGTESREESWGNIGLMFQTGTQSPLFIPISLTSP